MQDTTPTAMSSRLEKHKDLLKVLMKSNNRLAKSIIKEVDGGFILCLCEIIKNVLHGNVQVKDALKRRLRKHKITLRKLASRGTNVQDKRRMMQKGGIIPLLPLLTSTLGPILMKKIINK